MIKRGKEKADPDLVDTVSHTFGRRIDLDPEGQEDVRTP
jgi:hypothetical protein